MALGVVAVVVAFCVLGIAAIGGVCFLEWLYRQPPPEKRK